MSLHPSISRLEQFRLRRIGAIRSPMPAALCDVDAIREDLAEMVEAFNATGDPNERATLYRELTTLRARLAAAQHTQRKHT